MADIQFVVLFNGTSNDDKDPALTNVVKMRDGLAEDFVVYRDGVGNDQQWTWMTRWFSQFTGWGGGWVMDEAYTQILEKLNQGIKDGKVKENDVIHFSVSGFSRGAAIARHFGLEYIKDKLTKEIKAKCGLDLKIELAAEYLFDTVPSFGLPMNLWLLEKFGIKNQEIDIGWHFDIPQGTRAFHAPSVDEKRKAFTPHLVNFVQGETEEVWFDGDHSDVGGGHKPKLKDEVQADVNSLRYMVRHAKALGLRFKEAFLKAINIESLKDNPLGSIHTPSHEGMPPTQIGPRKIHVKADSKPSERLPLIAESVIRRMKADPQYRPESILNLKGKFCIYHESGDITQASSRVLQFSKKKSASVVQPVNDEPRVGETRRLKRSRGKGS